MKIEDFRSPIPSCAVSMSFLHNVRSHVKQGRQMSPFRRPLLSELGSYWQSDGGVVVSPGTSLVSRNSDTKYWITLPSARFENVRFGISIQYLDLIHPSIGTILCAECWCCLSSPLGSLAIGHNPGWVATPTQDTSKLALILPTSDEWQAESTPPGINSTAKGDLNSGSSDPKPTTPTMKPTPGIYLITNSQLHPNRYYKTKQTSLTNAWF